MKRRGFTLIDLMVSVTIIGILASISMLAISSARESARKDATRATITKLHWIIAKKVDEYRARRLPIKLDRSLPSDFGTYTQAQKQAYLIERSKRNAKYRINALRDLMRLEMPDRYLDITRGPIYLYPEGTAIVRYRNIETGEWVTETRTASRLTSLSGRYERIFNNTKTATTAHAAAECLYMIVSAIPGAIEQFHESEIGDYDNDGMPEFIDAWGMPIRFIRWPAGFLPPEADTTLQDGTTHGPLDPLGLLPDYKTFPLIYSAGPDGIYDINRGVDDEGNTMPYILSPSDDVDTLQQDSNGNLVGLPLDGTTPDKQPENKVLDHVDNITNHSLGLKERTI